MDEPRIHIQCIDPNCDRPAIDGRFCAGHRSRHKTGSRRVGPIQTAIRLIDEPVITCPDELLPLAGQCAENDAKAILRLIWPHFLEARLAGLEPFSLDAAS